MAEVLLPLTRGVILARLLSPTNFGLAISVTVVAGIAELASDLGVAQMALRAGTETNLPTLHVISLVRATILGLCIAAAGPLFEYLFRTQGTAHAYWIVGAAAALKGFSHLEPKLRMRRYDYGPEAVSIISGHLAWTMTSVIAAVILRDYRAMAIGLVANSLALVIVSQALSRSRFQIGWNRDFARDALAFGRPLVANGVALSITNLGDRLLVGARIGLEPLARYTALASAAFLPRSAVIKFMTQLFLPQFVNAATEQAIQRLSAIWIISLSLFATLYGLSFVAIGQWLVSVAFGQHYLVDQGLITLTGSLATIRLLAVAPVAPSLAAGRTSLVLITTILSASGLAVAALFLLRWSGLPVMLGAMIAGEGIGLLFVLRNLTRITPFRPGIFWSAVASNYMLVGSVAILVGGEGHVSAVARLALCFVAVCAQVCWAGYLLRRSGATRADAIDCFFPRRRRVEEAVLGLQP